MNLLVQRTVTFSTGDHVNVLHDYKKTRSSTILKLRTCYCHHLTDMLDEFCKNHIFLTLLKCLSVPYPSMFINFRIKYFAHAPCGEKLPKILMLIEILKTSTVTLPTSFTSKLANVSAQMHLCQMMIFF